MTLKEFCFMIVLQIHYYLRWLLEPSSRDSFAWRIVIVTDYSNPIKWIEVQICDPIVGSQEVWSIYHRYHHSWRYFYFSCNSSGKIPHWKDVFWNIRLLSVYFPLVAKLFFEQWAVIFRHNTDCCYLSVRCLVSVRDSLFRLRYVPEIVLNFHISFPITPNFVCLK